MYETHRRRSSVSPLCYGLLWFSLSNADVGKASPTSSRLASRDERVGPLPPPVVSCSHTGTPGSLLAGSQPGQLVGQQVAQQSAALSVPHRPVATGAGSIMRRGVSPKTAGHMERGSPTDSTTAILLGDKIVRVGKSLFRAAKT